MDCIDLLIADHNRARGMFKKFKDAEKADDLDGMRDATKKILDELAVHMEAEETVFYRAIRGETEDIDDTIYEGCEEHHVGKLLMAELRDMEPSGDEQWKAKVGVLIEVTQHHLDEEEEDMFPKVRGMTTAEQRDRVGTKFHAKRVALGGPSMDEALEHSKAELEQMARDQEIPGRSKLDKEHLAMTVDPRAA